MKTNEIADIILRDLREKSFPVFTTTYAGQGMHEMDVMGINRNKYIYEFEIKRSRADFAAEFRNKGEKHIRLATRDSIRTYTEWDRGKQTGNTYNCILIPNRYFFVCEEGLIKPEEVPDYAGLIYVNKDLGYPKEIKRARLLHKHKVNSRIYERVATMLSRRMLYGCSYATYKFKQSQAV